MSGLGSVCHRGGWGGGSGVVERVRGHGKVVVGGVLLCFWTCRVGSGWVEDGGEMVGMYRVGLGGSGDVYEVGVRIGGFGGSCLGNHWGSCGGPGVETRRGQYCDGG